jgi:RNA polymerase sigma-70 factor, ECF subfamily
MPSAGLLQSFPAAFVSGVEHRSMRRFEDIPELTPALQAGGRPALDQLLPVIYEELKAVAHRQLSRERPDHTLNTTGLVHEAYLKLSASGLPAVDRAHFFAIAARAMRHILIDYANQRSALKRGGNAMRVPLDDVPLLAEQQSRDLLDLEDALRRLETRDARQVRIVECRFFGGMSIDETAQALAISPATVKRDWTTARAWLNRELTQ